MRKTHIIVLVLLSSFFSCKAQEVASTSSSSKEGLIIGTWVIEGLTLNNKWVINTDGTLQEYSGSLVDITYNWVITQGTTPSGLNISHLKITNVSDATDVYDFEIDALNDERMVLVYQRPSGGIAKRATYFRQ